MNNKTEIQNRIQHAEAMSTIGPVPNDGPAVYQERAAYLAAIDQNLALAKDIRRDAEKGKTSKKGKVAAGLAVAVSALAIAVPGGVARDTYNGVRTFPAHVAYLYDRYVDKTTPSSPPENISFGTPSG